jgi:formamidopyrimidine-DNA glycosylase
MPELPEAEYMKLRLQEFAVQPVIRKVSVWRPSIVAPQTEAMLRKRLHGATITAFERRAKNVLLHLDNDHTVRIQLGMTGHVYGVETNADVSRAAVSRAAVSRWWRVGLELKDGRSIVFEDSRTFGSLRVVKTAELPREFTNYGPEPLDKSWSWTDLRDSAAKNRGPIKPFLLDQKRVVGLGNIWAAESCFEASIAPQRSVASLSDAEWKQLHAAIRKVLTRAIRNTMKVTRAAEEFPEADLLSCAVYGKAGEACPRCHAMIRRFVQAGRSTFHCAACQQ